MDRLFDLVKNQVQVSMYFIYFNYELLHYMLLLWSSNNVTGVWKKLIHMSEQNNANIYRCRFVLIVE